MPVAYDSLYRKHVLSIILLLLLIFCGGTPAFSIDDTKLTIAIIAYDTQFLEAQIGLKDGLEKLGYFEELNVNFLTYNLKKDLSSIPAIVDKLKQRNCDLIVTITTPVTLVVKKSQQGKHPIPVVFTMVANPLSSGVILDMAKPAGFITGIAYNAFKIMPKKLELFREAFPKIKKLAIFYNHDEEWLSQPIKNLFLPAANQLGFEIMTYHICRHTNFDMIMQAFDPDIEGIFMVPDPVAISIFPNLVKLSRLQKLPMMVLDNSLLPKGGIIGYSPTFFAVGQQAASIVAKILKGTPAGDLAVQTTKNIQLAVSLREANNLQIELHETFLRQCDLILR